MSDAVNPLLVTVNVVVWLAVVVVLNNVIDPVAVAIETPVDLLVSCVTVAPAPVE